MARKVVFNGLKSHNDIFLISKELLTLVIIRLSRCSFWNVLGTICFNMPMSFEPSQSLTCQDLIDAVLSSLLLPPSPWQRSHSSVLRIHSCGAAGAVGRLNPSCFGSVDVIVAVNLENYGSMDLLWQSWHLSISLTLRGSLLLYYFSHSL